MKRFQLGAVALFAASLAGGLAFAGGHGQNPAISARQGAMAILNLNIGVLVPMARGDVEYDAETAQAAADNLLAIVQLDPRFYWPQGTDSDSVEGTRALPAIWEDMGAFGAQWGAYVEAATALQAAAGGGLEAMQGAIGPVGAACGDCHDDFRLRQQ